MMKINFKENYKPLLILFLIVLLLIFNLLQRKNNASKNLPKNYIVTSDYESKTKTKNNQYKDNRTILDLNKDTIKTRIYIGKNLPKIGEAEQEILKLEKQDHLILYIKEFKTSVGINTTIIVSHSNNNPSFAVELLVLGISYEENDTDIKNNINFIAYKESVIKAFNEIEAQGGNPNKIYYILGHKESIQKVAETWMNNITIY